MKLRTIEIAVATIVLIMALYGLYGSVTIYVNNGYNSVHSFDRDLFAARGYQFNFFVNYLLPFILLYLSVYASWIWICCSLPDKLIAQKQWGKALISILSGWLVLWLILTLREYLLAPYQDHILEKSLYREFGEATGITVAIFFYEAGKHLIMVLLNRAPLNSRGYLFANGKPNVLRDFIVASAVWVVVFLLLNIPGLPDDYRILWVFVVEVGLLLYTWSLAKIIPFVKRKKYGFMHYLFLFSLAFMFLLIPVYFLIQLTLNSVDQFLLIASLNCGVQLFIVAPGAWFIYERRLLQASETGLKTELGNSNAGLQFLRSQINPHFLFNALNTLYGTALIEKAEKTGEGIQKLGDMMRFMLHENNQDKIALSREIDYLHNYIGLQNMRLALSPDITVDVQIEDLAGYDEIAPMLLIPFVENAYKHGISLQERSWINISLYKKDNVLHLDVHNSTHAVNLNDPEYYHSGTGLENAKQRLQLIYPENHELIIRHNTKEYFVHLTITLNS